MVHGEQRDGHHDVAIVGMACRFPGARNLSEYWRLLKEPKPQFSAVPESRWGHDAFFADGSTDPHSAYSDQIAVVSDVDMFDALHYRIPPRRAKFMDPQHRLLVDLTREAIQDAGWEQSGFDRENAAVVMGLSESGYRQISVMNLRLRQIAAGEYGRAMDPALLSPSGCAVAPFDGTALPGLLLSMGPTTVSSVFGLQGVSYATDAACASGLAAVSQAVQALRADRCDTAFVGAAQLFLVPDLLVGLCRIGAVSRAGQCRPFDRRADGLLLGEGAGVLVLRRLPDALAAGDRIYAIIRGVGTSNDGTVPGGMTPQAAGQLLALRRAYDDAALDPGTVGFLEAHGTATAVGDQVEVHALQELRGQGAPSAYLGAVKAIIGHSLVASGIAGLIKTALVLHTGLITPQPAFEAAEHLGLDAAGLQVPTCTVPWPAGATHPRRAGVSAFGFGGTDVHLVLEAAEAPEAPEAGDAPDAGTHPGPRSRVLLLSAPDRSALARYARDVADVMAENGLALGSVAATLARRSTCAVRLGVVADAAADAVMTLRAAAESLVGEPTDELPAGAVTGTAAPRGKRSGAGQIVRPNPQERSAVLTEHLAAVISAPELRLVVDDAPSCTLPPSPLRPRRHWITDDHLRAEGLTPPPLASAGAEVPPAGAGIPSADAGRQVAAAPRAEESAVGGMAVGQVRSAVCEEISAVTALTGGELRDEQCLGDLGFDSLMLNDLAARLTRKFPGTVRIEESLTGLTVGSIVELLAGSDAGDAPDRTMTSSGTTQADQSLPAWDVASAEIERFPEVSAIEARLLGMSDEGFQNPYFRTHEGNVRNTTVIGNKEYVCFSSYNYLGLSGHPHVLRAVNAAVEQYGSSVSASRLLGGERPLTRELERELAGLLGTQACLALVSGHATNVTTVGHVVGADDLIIHDALAHDSILQGCALSGARRRPFAHNDPDNLEYLLRQMRGRFRRVLIVVEGAYSMDGDLADLPRLVDLKSRYGALLMVDEAHSLGTVGDHGGGVGEFFGIDRSGVDLWMGTLSKALASCGGYLAGSAKVIRWLRYTLPGFVYSVGLTPPNAAAALAALEVMKSEPGRVKALRANSELFLSLARSAGVRVGASADTPIVPCIVGDSEKTLRLAAQLYDKGVVVDPILYPAVDQQATRLRFFITSEHSESEIRNTVATLVQCLEACP